MNDNDLKRIGYNTRVISWQFLLATMIMSVSTSLALAATTNNMLMSIFLTAPIVCIVIELFGQAYDKGMAAMMNAMDKPDQNG